MTQEIVLENLFDNTFFLSIEFFWIRISVKWIFSHQQLSLNRYVDLFTWA